MDVFEAVKTMLAIRSYEDREIPQETVDRILQAARLTASSQNKQHWDFIVVRDRKRLQELAQLASHGPYMANAAMAIAVAVPDAPIGYVDGARAVQDMMLVAWADGVGSNWVGRTNTKEIKEFLNIPQERLLLTIIPFGYPGRKVGKGRKDRKPLEEIVHWEQYGSKQYSVGQ